MEQQLPLQPQGHGVFNAASSNYGDRDIQPKGAVCQGQDQQVSKAALMKGLASQLQSSGALGHVKSQLRAQLLSQLQKGQVISLQSPSGGAPSLKQRALDSMLVEYFQAANYPYSLSVFSEESGTAATPPLSGSEALDVFHINKASLLHQAYIKVKSKATAGAGKCTLLHLLDALTELGQASRGLDSSTQTAGSERHQLETRMAQLESDYQVKLRAVRMQPAQGTEERMALYRQQIEEQARADVARQVERVREIEMASVRLEEAAKWRRTLEGERQELERLHTERLTKLRSREEEITDKLKRQQREVEALAFDHRQRLLREEERIRAWRQEASSALDGREEQLKHLARALELREKAVVSREVSAESKAAEASQALSTAHVDARAEVEKEYLELKATLAGQRLQLEMDRARVAEMRSEAAAESTAARTKEDRLRALEAARMEAEARAAAHAAEAGSVRLQMERLQLELAAARDELSHRVAQAAGTADAMLTNAAGALNMLGKEAQSARGAVQQLQQLQHELSASETRLAAQAEEKEKLGQERDKAVAQALAAAQQVKQLIQQREQLAHLIEEALAARGMAQKEAEESQFACQQLQREVSELRASLVRAREDAMSARIHSAGPASQPAWAASRSASAASGLQHAQPSQIAAFRPGRGMAADAQKGINIGQAGHPFERHQYGLSNQQIYVLSPPKHAANSIGLVSNPNICMPSLEARGAAMGADINLTTPVKERLARLARQEDDLAGEMAGFKRRVAAQQQAGARELQLAMTRVDGSPTPSSPHTSVTPSTSRPVSPGAPYVQPSWRQPPSQQMVMQAAAALPTTLHTASVSYLGSYPTQAAQPATAGLYSGPISAQASAPAMSELSAQYPAQVSSQVSAQVPVQTAGAARSVVGVQQGVGSLGGFHSLPSPDTGAQLQSTNTADRAQQLQGGLAPATISAASMYTSVATAVVMQSREVSVSEAVPASLSTGQSDSVNTDTCRSPAAGSLSFSDIPYGLLPAQTATSTGARMQPAHTQQEEAREVPASALAAPIHLQQGEARTVPTTGDNVSGYLASHSEVLQQALSFSTQQAPTVTTAMPSITAATGQPNTLPPLPKGMPAATATSNVVGISNGPSNGALYGAGSTGAWASPSSTAVAAPAGLTLVRQFSGVATSVATEPGVMTALLAQSRASSDLALSELLKAEGTHAEPQHQQVEPPRSFVTQSMSLEDVRNAQAAKLRVLQQQQEARLAAQRGEAKRQSADSDPNSEAEEYEDDFGSHHSSPSHSSVGSSGGSSRPAAPSLRARQQSSSPASSTGSSNSTHGRRPSSRPIAGRRSFANQQKRATDDSSSHHHQQHSTNHSPFRKQGSTAHSLREHSSANHSFRRQSSSDHAVHLLAGVDSGSEQDEELQLETAEERHTSRRSVNHNSASGGGSGSLPSQLAELHLSMDEDSELVVELDDDDDDDDHEHLAQALGGTALNRSSDGSVF